MRILLIHQAFASVDEAGGTRHYELARYCTARGHGFTVVASNLSYLSGQPTVDRVGWITEQTLESVRILRVQPYASLHRSFFWRILSFLSFMFLSVRAALWAGPVDLVMGTSPPMFQAVSAWLVAALRRKPFLLEIRDLWPEFAIDMGILKNTLLIALSRELERFLYARATHILVNSPAYREYLLGKGLLASKITLIANGVDPDMFDPAATGERIRRSWRLDGQFVVTYAGALGLANDIPTILSAADRLRNQPQIHFLLVGDGKERRNLEAQAQALSLPNITFTGARPKQAIPDILAASDTCIATLKDISMFRTTYPNKVFDYMAAGRPVILAIDGVIRQVIETAEAGIFVPPGDSQALAAAVQLLHRDSRRARQMGEAGRAYVIRYFNRHQQAGQFVELAQAMEDAKRPATRRGRKVR